MVEVTTKAEDTEEAKEAEVEVEMTEGTFTMDIILNKRYCVVF